MFQVPAVLVERASRDRGAEGRDWIRQLPDIITVAQHRWSLGPEAVLPLGKELSVLVAGHHARQPASGAQSLLPRC